ncbi:hypothetical protein DTO169C6_4495 [Paecilomyces variotii]|nr:hypothetical protein DTO169C6_4495 [Paecilomyces variotii]KAJ9382702.1 hypothetical protein DTO063F5_5541 [Paecilomyces variotii]
MALFSPKQILNTSWSVHRLSPLHHGKEFPTLLDNATALQTYADRLKETLTGDVLRGVQVGVSAAAAGYDDALLKAGPLQQCAWRVMPTWSHFREEDESLLDDPENTQPSVPPENAFGILMILEYENIVYKAALLAGPDGYHDDRKGSTYLPVLLTRLPNSLRQTLISFLATNFDTYCTVLRLPSSFLCTALETYISVLSPTRSRSRPSSSDSILEEVLKETQLTLSFSSHVAPNLRTLDLNLPRATVSTFVAEGLKNVKKVKSGPSQQRPFLSSLCAYIDKHLAMKLSLDDQSAEKGPSDYVKLTKVACGAFVLGAEGRMKLVADHGYPDSRMEDDDPEEMKNRLLLQANEEILRALVRRAIPEHKKQN